MGQWKGRGAKKHHPTARGAHQGQAGARDPRGKVCWDRSKAATKERWEEDTCSSPSEGEEPSSSPLPPPQSSLLFSAAFLIPASSSGASGVNPIRSNLGEAAGSAQTSPSTQSVGRQELGVLCPSLAPTGQWILSPHPSHSPKGSHPALSPKALTRRA